MFASRGNERHTARTFRGCVRRGMKRDIQWRGPAFLAIEGKKKEKSETPTSSHHAMPDATATAMLLPSRRFAFFDVGEF